MHTRLNLNGLSNSDWPQLMIFLPWSLILQLQVHYVFLVKILIQDVLHIRKIQVESTYGIQ